MTEDRVAPRTAAGRALLNIFPFDAPPLAAVIAEVEAEAASLDSDELRKAVEALRPRAMEFTTERAGFEDGLEAVLALLSAGNKAAHVHEWIDARNEVVEAGEVCLCGAFRAGNRSAGDKAEAPPTPFAFPKCSECGNDIMHAEGCSRA